MNIGNYVRLYSEELTRKGYRNETIKNYVSCVTVFLNSFNESVTKPTEINEQKIKDFLRKFNEHNTQRGYHSSIKCFYKYVCKQPNKFKYIEYCKKKNKLPIVLSVDEIGRIIHCASNVKHKAILCLMYSTGIRVGEVINLKISDIDSSRMIINIRDAKGGKDRQVPLDKTLLELLRIYWLQYKLREYIFNGQNSLQYSARSISKFLQKYADMAKIKKRVYPHLIRHCSFTHLVENETDINLIQRIAGHNNVKTTNIYLHISHNYISKIITPLQNITIKNFLNTQHNQLIQ